MENSGKLCLSGVPRAHPAASPTPRGVPPAGSAVPLEATTLAAAGHEPCRSRGAVAISGVICAQGVALLLGEPPYSWSHCAPAWLAVEQDAHMAALSALVTDIGFDTLYLSVHDEGATAHVSITVGVEPVSLVEGA